MSTSTFPKAPKTMRPLGIVFAVLGMTLGFMGAYVLKKSRELDTTLGNVAALRYE